MSATTEVLKAIKQYFFLDITFKNPTPNRLFAVKDGEEHFTISFRYNREMTAKKTSKKLKNKKKSITKGVMQMDINKSTGVTYYAEINFPGFKEKPVLTQELIEAFVDALDMDEAIAYFKAENPSRDGSIENCMRMYMLLQYTDQGSDLKLVNHATEEAEFVYCDYDREKEQVKFSATPPDELEKIVPGHEYLDLEFSGGLFDDKEFKAALDSGAVLDSKCPVVQRLSEHVVLQEAIDHFVQERDDCMTSNFLS